MSNGRLSAIDCGKNLIDRVGCGGSTRRFSWNPTHRWARGTRLMFGIDFQRYFQSSNFNSSFTLPRRIHCRAGRHSSLTTIPDIPSIASRQDEPPHMLHRLTSRPTCSTTSLAHVLNKHCQKCSNPSRISSFRQLPTKRSTRLSTSCSTERSPACPKENKRAIRQSTARIEKAGSYNWR